MQGKTIAQLRRVWQRTIRINQAAGRQTTAEGRRAESAAYAAYDAALHPKTILFADEPTTTQEPPAEG